MRGRDHLPRWRIVPLVLLACAASPNAPPSIAPERAPSDATIDHDAEPTPTIATSDPASDEGEPPPTAYDRDEWPHWIDADHDCQDTHTEVLVRAAIGPVEYVDARRCKIRRGKWRCPYTGRVVTDPHAIDVDHMIPLAHAHAAGGWKWSRAKKTAFANDLEDPQALVAVVAGANRSKGARTIVEWLPENRSDRCDYVDAWVAMKAKWNLAVDDAERRATERYENACRTGDIPLTERERAEPANDMRVPTEPEGGCCRYCTHGKPCGDACIAVDRTCHQPPGCACEVLP